MTVNVMVNLTIRSFHATISTFTEGILGNSVSSTGSTNEKTSQDPLADYPAPKPNLNGRNGSGTIGFGIPDSLESTYIVNSCVGTILLVIGLVGVAGNSLVLYVFTRFRLRGGGGPLILSLASGDFFVSVLHALPAYSSFKNEWAFGTVGCNFYAASMGLCGIASLLTMTAIAADRFSIIVGRSNVWITGIKSCVAIWIVSAAITFPPLFGWSRYCLEGLGTSCSWDYMSRDFYNRLYYIFLLTIGFVFPVCIIITSYLGILLVVCKQKSQLSIACKDGRLMKAKKATKNDIKTAQVISTIIILFLLAWTPYAIVSLIGQFGDESSPVSPMATAISGLFAKMSVIINPIVYGLSHPSFRSAVRTLRSEGFASKVYRSYPKKNKNSYRYNGSIYTYASRLTSAAKLKELYNGTRLGSGERLRRQTTRQRELWRRRSPNTRMKSDMMTVYPKHSCYDNELIVVEGSSLLQKHLVSIKNLDQVHVLQMQNISKYCDAQSAPELHGDGDTKNWRNSSAKIESKRRRKYVQSTRAIPEDTRRFKVQGHNRKEGQKPLSRSENSLDLSQISIEHLKSSMRSIRSLCTIERVVARVAISDINRVHKHINSHSSTKGGNVVSARSVSFASEDILGTPSISNQEESRENSLHQFTIKRKAPKRSRLNLGRNLWSKRDKPTNKCKALSVNQEEFCETKKGFPQVLRLKRLAVAALHEDKMSVDSEVNKSGGSDPVNIACKRKSPKKSTLKCWRHKILGKSPLAQKIFWKHHEKQGGNHQNNSGGASYGDYPSGSSYAQDYYSSFI